MKLSEQIRARRTDRLDEWSMDGIAISVSELEQQNAKLMEALNNVANYNTIGIELRNAYEFLTRIVRDAQQALTEVEGE